MEFACKDIRHGSTLTIMAKSYRETPTLGLYKTAGFWQRRDHSGVAVRAARDNQFNAAPDTGSLTQADFAAPQAWSQRASLSLVDFFRWG
jgi:hypothetical protein